ncbi:MAG: hypothetical protein KKA73_00320 [Chloroflexi bacterium]|nr:hypothetical protein [Chloroflexota bacterium]MBU1746106.1 hypothetical protein [Chloroflexota bacterium]
MAKKDFSKALRDGPLATKQDRSVGPLRRISDLAVEHLVFLGQPRQIIPPAQLQQLVDTGHNHPPEVLAVLQHLAADNQPASQRVLASLQTMAKSMCPPDGRVWQPILYRKCGENDSDLVVLDGHRRCLAACLAGLTVIPGVEVVMIDDTTAVRFAQVKINLDRDDLTAMEMAWEVADLRDHLMIEMASQYQSSGHVSTEMPVQTLGDEPSGHVSTEMPVQTLGDEPSGHVSTEMPSERTLQAQVRDEILRQLPKIGKSYYYYLLRLADRLGPGVQDRAYQDNLTEAQLRAVATHIQSPELQYACVQAIATHDLPKRDADALVAAVLAGADPATEAARLTRARQPATAAKSAKPRPQVPDHLGKRGRSLWTGLQRVTRDWGWATDTEQSHRRLRALSGRERDTLLEQAAQARALLEEVENRLREDQ